MRIVKTIAEAREARSGMTAAVGFVPTMGYLHEGHLALVRRARRENQNLVVSIFVNPSQFGPREDFKSYPRDTDRDLSLLEKEKTDIVFIPRAEEIYPPGYCTWVDVEKLTERLEGASRPGHFRGVATVVAKLLNIVKPNRAYFGQKDAQQLLVVRRMAADLDMDLEIIAVPTVREPDGLAMSSRNAYLNKEERRAATVLWRALNLAQELWARGEDSAKRLRAAMTELIATEPLASIDYVSVADATTLQELERIDRPALVSIAVKIGHTRLIDNVIIETSLQ